MYIAHINEKDDNYQSVEEHSYNVAKLAEAFSVQPMGNVVFNAGLFHDVGKFQALFQRRISGEDVRVEHSGCGAQLCVKNYPNSLLGFVMAYCIAGHHSGLPNGGSKNDTADMATLYGRIEREYEDYSAWEGSLSAKTFSDSDFKAFLIADCQNDKRKIIDKLAFWIRYCFSCLTDADTIDSAGFCGEDIVAPMKTDFKRCLMRLNEHFNSFEAHTVLQKKRSAIQAQVFEGLQQSSEIYTINMPTGSGKTLCSVKFALEKAIAAGKKRIIYVIPYNSIIDQTASVFEGIFGLDMELLRHQSTFSYSDDEQYSSEYSVKAKYNSENWQADFIITTAVQFFETICSHQKSRLRKLHNMADSIIVFDEVHQLPLKYLRPCLQAVTCVTKYLNAQAVFMTATMPDFKPLLEKYSFANTNVVDLVRDKKDFIYFRKCHYDFLAQQDREFIVQQALEAPSALIIVNKRQTARDIFSLCTGEKYHLSTYMTARDRERTISRIKMRLSSLAADYPDWKNVPPKRRICVVSTSLIEAGVDLDFYTVYRELTGLDSILQAGGRCNREGHREYGDVHIFELPDSGNDDIKTNLTRSIIEKYETLDSEEAIREYYDRLFAINDQQIDKMGMSGEKGAAVNISIPFQDIDMNMIDSPTISLVVMQDEACRKMIEGLRFSGRANVRSLQKYTCTIYCYELEQLSKQGVVDDCNGIIWLTDEKYYDEKIGIIFEGRDYIVGDEGDIMSITVPSEGGRNNIMSFGFKIMAEGDYACFTRPEMKVERVSYDWPTPSALEGMLKSIYWKPAIRYVIDKIVVFNKIEFANIRRNEVKEKMTLSAIKKQMKNEAADPSIYTSEKRSQRAAMVLKNVKYGIQFHFELTGLKNDHADECEEKHFNIIKRRLTKGQFFRVPCFGCAEFPVKRLELVEDFDYNLISDEIVSMGEVDYGFMLYGPKFADGGKPLNNDWDEPLFSDKAVAEYYRPRMIKGIIDVAKYREARLC